MTKFKALIKNRIKAGWSEEKILDTKPKRRQVTLKWLDNLKRVNSKLYQTRLMQYAIQEQKKKQKQAIKDIEKQEQEIIKNKKEVFYDDIVAEKDISHYLWYLNNYKKKDIKGEPDAGYEKDIDILKPDNFEEANQIIKYKNFVKEKHASQYILTREEINKIMGR